MTKTEEGNVCIHCKHTSEYVEIVIEVVCDSCHQSKYSLAFEIPSSELDTLINVLDRIKQKTS